MPAQLTNRAERLAQIEQLLARNVRGLRAVEIAEACGVDRRTIYRDIALLNHAGVPVAQEYGRFYLDRDQYLARVRLTYAEITALFLAALVLTRQSRFFNPHLVGAAHKLLQSLPDSLHNSAETLLQSPAYTSVDVDHGELPLVFVVDTVIRAWTERRPLRMIVTHRTGKPRIIEMAIYVVDSKPNGTLYAVGYDALSEQICSVKLERIRRIRLLTGTYQIPSTFDAQDYIWKRPDSSSGSRGTSSELS